MNRRIFLGMFFMLLMTFFVSAAPSITSVAGKTVQSGDDYVEITFSENVSSSDWENSFDFINMDSTALELDMAVFAYDDSKNVLRISLDQNEQYLLNGKRISVKPKLDSIQNEAGEKVPSTAVTSSAITGDTTKPKLDKVTMESDNANVLYAKAGDSISLIVKASEDIIIDSVKIAGTDVTLPNSYGKDFNFELQVLSTMPQGKVSLLVKYHDLAGNVGTDLTSVTTGSAVTIDTQAPVLDMANSVSSRKVEARFSESILATSVQVADFDLEGKSIASVSVSGSVVSIITTEDFVETSTFDVSLVGSVTDIAGNEASQKTITSTMKSRLEFVDLEYEVTFPRSEDPDDEDGDFDDGDTIEVGEGAKVLIMGKVENIFNTAMEIDDIDVELEIRKMDDGDTLEEKIGLDDLEDGDDDSFEFEFTVPYDEFDDGDSVLAKLSVEGTDENNVKHSAVVEFYLEIEKESYEVTILKAYVDNAELSCERKTMLNVELKNTGLNDLDEDNPVGLLIEGGKLVEEMLWDIEMGDSDRDDDNELTFSFEVDASDLSPSTTPYRIKIVAYEDNDDESDMKYVFVTVKDCDGSVTSTTQQTATTTTSKPAVTTTLETNYPSGQTQGPSYAQFPSTAKDDKGTSIFKDTDSYVILLVVVIVLLLVIAGIMFANLMRK